MYKELWIKFHQYENFVKILFWRRFTLLDYGLASTMVEELLSVYNIIVMHYRSGSSSRASEGDRSEPK